MTPKKIFGSLRFAPGVAVVMGSAPCESYAQFTDVTCAALQDATGATKGAAWADIDSDGWDDITWVNGSGPVRVAINNGDGTFTDVTAQWNSLSLVDANQPVYADMDNDGDPDLYVACGSGVCFLLRNDGAGAGFVNVGLGGRGCRRAG